MKETWPGLLDPDLDSAGGGGGWGGVAQCLDGQCYGGKLNN